MKDRGLFRFGFLLVLSVGLVLSCGPATVEPTPAPTPALAGTKGPEPVPTAASERPASYVGDAEAAIDMALGYMNKWHGNNYPAPGLTWIGDYASGADVVGAETILFTSKGAPGWTITVSYPVVAPEAVIYQVMAINEEIGFRWVGKVDATGQVTELNVSIEQ
jgi:hypothetical protein